MRLITTPRRVALSVAFLVSCLLVFHVFLKTFHPMYSLSHLLQNAHPPSDRLQQGNLETLSHSTQLQSEESQVEQPHSRQLQSEESQVEKPQSCEGCTLRKPVFQNPNSSTVALGSFHGAGNTWTRHLIEQITGVYTGSIYHSPHLSPGFPGEIYHDGRVSVVKTHRYSSRWDRAILLYRNIKDCNVANFHRTGTRTNIGRVSLEKFKSERWLAWVNNESNIKRFVNFWDAWMANYHQDKIIILRYEKMIADLFPQLVRIRDFLGVNTTDEQLHCVVCLREGSYHRKKVKDAQDPWENLPQEIVQKFDDAEKHISDLIAPYI